MLSKISSSNSKLPKSGSNACLISAAKLCMVSESSISLSFHSLLDYQLDRENRDRVCALLRQLDYSESVILAVWLVQRPVHRGHNETDSHWKHWCVKVLCGQILLSIDFLECQGSGAFGLKKYPTSAAHLDTFFKYPSLSSDRKHVVACDWEILASATPRKAKYQPFLDASDAQMLRDIILHSKMADQNAKKFLRKIEFGKSLWDISTFCKRWTAKHTAYNALYANCQKFAAQLFHFLVGEQFPLKTKYVFSQYQSPVDVRDVENGIASDFSHALHVEQRRRQQQHAIQLQLESQARHRAQEEREREQEREQKRHRILVLPSGSGQQRRHHQEVGRAHRSSRHNHRGSHNHSSTCDDRHRPLTRHDRQHSAPDVIRRQQRPPAQAQRGRPHSQHDRHDRHDRHGRHDRRPRQSSRQQPPPQSQPQRRSHAQKSQRRHKQSRSKYNVRVPSPKQYVPLLANNAKSSAEQPNVNNNNPDSPYI